MMSGARFPGLSAAAMVALSACAAAARAPHLAGALNVDPATGEVAGDLCVSGAEFDRFVLNAHLDVREVRSATDGTVSPYVQPRALRESGDGVVHELGAATDGACVRFDGRFTIYDVERGEMAASDWKGRIAFDGRTVRMAEQARFYPVVLDKDGRELIDVTYDVEVTCATCRSLYWSGEAPVAGPVARFRSDVPRQLLLYAGEFPFRTVNGMHFVGAPASDAAVQRLHDRLRRIAAAHSAYLDLPAAERPTLLSFAAVGGGQRRLGKLTWGFVTWPTIASDGRLDFETLLDAQNSTLEDTRWIAHESAHQFFGTRYQPSGPLRWFLLESTAEFMAIKAVGRLEGAHAERAAVKDLVYGAGGELRPLSQIEREDEVGEAYRYYRGPLLLFALEGAVGERPMKDLLRGLVLHPPAGPVTWPVLRKRLAEAGAADSDIAAFERVCLTARLSADCSVLAGGPVRRTEFWVQ